MYQPSTVYVDTNGRFISKAQNGFCFPTATIVLNYQFVNYIFIQKAFDLKRIHNGDLRQNRQMFCIRTLHILTVDPYLWEDGIITW